MLEHPEDLGARLRGDPASIGRMEQTAKSAKATGAKRVAVHQCAFRRRVSTSLSRARTSMERGSLRQRQLTHLVFAKQSRSGSGHLCLSLQEGDQWQTRTQLRLNRRWTTIRPRQIRESKNQKVTRPRGSLEDSRDAFSMIWKELRNTAVGCRRAAEAESRKQGSSGLQAQQQAARSKQAGKQANKQQHLAASEQQ